MERLLCIISSMNAGGAETFLMKLYRQLDRDNYQMDFCINEVGAQHYTEEINALGGKIFYVPPKSNGIVSFRRALTEVVKKNNYKYVMKIASNAIGFYDLKIAKDAGAIKCICRSSNSSDGGSIKMKFVNVISRILFGKFVDIKIAPSDLAAMYTYGKKDFYNDSITILHNAIDIDEYSFNTNIRKKVRTELDISEKDFVIGHVGRFQTQKNHAFLIDIFSEIHKKVPLSKLLLIGDGELRNEIEKKVREKNLHEAVIFAGIQSNVSAFLSAMDVFVFPSFYEGMPNTVIEAQASGMSCFISDTITKQANITGMVEYLSLENSAKYWASQICSRRENRRIDAKPYFVKSGYEIKKIAKQFEILVFGDKQ